MAEIKIEKKSSPIWPWILLIILIVAGVIWYFSDNADGMRRTDQTDQEEQYQDTSSYQNDMYDNNLNQ